MSNFPLGKGLGGGGATPSGPKKAASGKLRLVLCKFPLSLTPSINGPLLSQKMPHLLRGRIKEREEKREMVLPNLGGVERVAQKAEGGNKKKIQPR